MPAPTPKADHKNSLCKICSKGWVARAPFLLMGSAVRCSKGWARRDANLVMQTGSTAAAAPPALRIGQT